MNRKDINICWKYGFTVNSLIDSIECVIGDVLCGKEITEEQIGYLINRIAMVRQREKPFKEIWDIKVLEGDSNVDEITYVWK